MTAANTTFPLLPSPFLLSFPSLPPSYPSLHRVTLAIMELMVLWDPKAIPVYLEEREYLVSLASTELTAHLVILG